MGSKFYIPFGKYGSVVKVEDYREVDSYILSFSALKTLPQEAL
jgi:hypothetical protein